MPRATCTTASAAIAAQAAVETYVALHPAYEGGMGVLLHSDIYSAPSGVVIEHEGFLLPDFVTAARDAVEAQGLRLETERWTYAWEVLA